MSHIPSKAMPHAVPHHDEPHHDDRHGAGEPGATAGTAPGGASAPDPVTPADHAGQAGRAEPGASPVEARAGTLGAAAAWLALGAGVIAAAVAVGRRIGSAPKDAAPPRPKPKPKRGRKAKHD